MSSSVFIATIGTKPQIVSNTIELLYRSSPPVQFQKVIVLHSDTVQDAVQSARLALRDDFNTIGVYPYPFQWEFCLLQDLSGQTIREIDSEPELNIFFESLYRMVYSLKQEGSSVHLLCSGGRKVMAMFAMVVAQLLLDENDFLWHLISSDSWVKQGKMHPENEIDIQQMKLISVPFLPSTFTFPGLNHTFTPDSPAGAVAAAKFVLQAEKRKKAARFIEQNCTPAERRVAEILSLSGAGNREIADQLHVSERTVEAQLRSLFMKASEYWEFETVTRTQFVVLTQIYFQVN